MESFCAMKFYCVVKTVVQQEVQNQSQVMIGKLVSLRDFRGKIPKFSQLSSLFSSFPNVKEKLSLVSPTQTSVV